MKRLALLCMLFPTACKVPDPPPVGDRFVDNFDRSDIGANYRPTSNAYHIEKGVLRIEGAFNHPLWLRKKLPPKAAIEFDCWSDSKIGDIKVELFGDGESFAESKTGQYTASGYVAVMGGWSNTRSILARGNEHGANLDQRQAPAVEPGKKYHWRLERDGNEITWFVDDMTTPFLKLTDHSPAEAKGNDYFAFSNWQSPLSFDNLSITPL